MNNSIATFRPFGPSVVHPNAPIGQKREKKAKEREREIHKIPNDSLYNRAAAVAATTIPHIVLGVYGVVDSDAGYSPCPNRRTPECPEIEINHLVR